MHCIYSDIFWDIQIATVCVITNCTFPLIPSSFSATVCVHIYVYVFFLHCIALLALKLSFILYTVYVCSLCIQLPCFDWKYVYTSVAFNWNINVNPHFTAHIFIFFNLIHFDCSFIHKIVCWWFILYCPMMLCRCKSHKYVLIWKNVCSTVWNDFTSNDS